MRAAPLIAASLGLSGIALAVWWYRRQQQPLSAPAQDSTVTPASTADQSTDAVSALASWDYADTTTLSTILNMGGLTAPRGIRNNNPGNVRRDGVTNWLGLADVQNDPDFWQFTSPVYGLRVIAYLLLGYQKRKGLRTVQQMISGQGGWAPVGSADKNPASYSAFVAAQIGVSQGAAIDLSVRADFLLGMVKAIVQFENGQQPYTDAVIQSAVDMARASYG